jgi:hypothetical protein
MLLRKFDWYLARMADQCIAIANGDWKDSPRFVATLRRLLLDFS